MLVHRADGKLKAGEYRIEANSSMRQVMDLLVTGKSIQYKVTIPEGLTTLQALARIEAHEVLVGDIEGEVAEGSLLPDTYAFTRGTTRQELVERMQAALSKLLDATWPNRDQTLPLTNPYEAVILASIVEKETALASERGRVASVFVNRLRQGMRLQSDPTIVYGIVGGQGALDRPIRKSDIAERTNYNTYQIDGLPPTPIANPGKAAIEAVLNPPETKDLFFVADGTGGHAFSETLAGHTENVRRWREIERARREPAVPDEPADPAAAVDPEPDASGGQLEQTAALDPEADAADLTSEPEASEPAAESEPVEPSPAPEASQADTETPPAEPETDAEQTSQPEPPTADTASVDPADDTSASDADLAPEAEPQQPPSPEPPGQAAPEPAPEQEPEQVASQTPPEADPTPEPDQAPEPAPDQQQVETAPEPAPKPEPPAISEIARAIIEKAPRPKPKPETSRNATVDTPEPVLPADTPSQVTVAPLPDAVPPAGVDSPAIAEPPVPVQVVPPPTQAQPQSPSASDLR